MVTEIWKDIKGFDGKYQVSNFGRIKAKEYSFTHIWCGKKKTSIRRERILKQSLDYYGYLHSGLQVSQGVQKRFLSHRLVAEAFIPNPENKRCVNHKNGIKTDNVVENLEWMTHSENSKHSFVIGLQCNKGENHPVSKLTECQVLEIRRKYKPYKYTVKMLCKEYSLSSTHVKDIIRRKSWPHI